MEKQVKPKIKRLSKSDSKIIIILENWGGVKRQVWTGFPSKLKLENLTGTFFRIGDPNIHSYRTPEVKMEAEFLLKEITTHG